MATVEVTKEDLNEIKSTVGALDAKVNKNHAMVVDVISTAMDAIAKNHQTVMDAIAENMDAYASQMDGIAKIMDAIANAHAAQTEAHAKAHAAQMAVLESMKDLGRSANY